MDIILKHRFSFTFHKISDYSPSFNWRTLIFIRTIISSKFKNIISLYMQLFHYPEKARHIFYEDNVKYIKNISKCWREYSYKYSITWKHINLRFFALQVLVFLNVELLRNTIIRNYRRGMNAKRTFHHKILSRAFKRSFRRNSKSFLKAERRERNSTIIQWMARTNRNGKHQDRGKIDLVLNSP